MARAGPAHGQPRLRRARLHARVHGHEQLQQARAPPPRHLPGVLHDERAGHVPLLRRVQVDGPGDGRDDELLGDGHARVGRRRARVRRRRAQRPHGREHERPLPLPHEPGRRPRVQDGERARLLPRELQRPLLRGHARRHGLHQGRLLRQRRDPVVRRGGRQRGLGELQVGGGRAPRPRRDRRRGLLRRPREAVRQAAAAATSPRAGSATPRTSSRRPT